MARQSIMDFVKELVIQAGVMGAIFQSRSALTKGSDSPLALFCLGLAASYFCRFILPLRYNPSNPLFSEFTRRRIKRQAKKGGLDPAGKTDLYGLEHTFLNMNLELPSMWENVGYWKNASGDFPTACRDLFEKTLTDARVFDSGSVSILELGCGCAEGALHLLSTRREQVANYVGLNINQEQARFCQQRLEDWRTTHGKQNEPEILRIFNADAAKPSSWPEELTRTVESYMVESKLSQEPAPRKWLLCQDSLYHFRAGREEILTHASKRFGTSLMATDFFIPEKMSFSARWLHWITLAAIQIPWWNMLTRQQYIDMLVRCGYDPSTIQIIDITEHAFTDYADFLTHQADKWVELGGSAEAIRPFVHWGWVLRYWGWANTLRSVIIVAHPK